MQNEYFAIINDDNSGPAMGTGTSEEAAWQDAAQWGMDDQEGYKAVEISKETFDAIKNGNPDAPR